MSLFQGKRNFWSQLLVSIVAFFALPQVNAAETQSHQPLAQQAEPQQIQCWVLSATIENQTQHLQQEAPQRAVAFTDVFHNKSYFPFFWPEHAPIRAGPIA
ncbi:MAG: secA translation cis-regulator SecM [Lonepinella koalarum]|nr:secA translation cis-regulator SecM [Lonepinella koalarum]